MTTVGTPDGQFPDAAPSAPKLSPEHRAAATEAGATGVCATEDKHWWQKSENISPDPVRPCGHGN